MCFYLPCTEVGHNGKQGPSKCQEKSAQSSAALPGFQEWKRGTQNSLKGQVGLCKHKSTPPRAPLCPIFCFRVLIARSLPPNGAYYSKPQLSQAVFAQTVVPQCHKPSFAPPRTILFCQLQQFPISPLSYSYCQNSSNSSSRVGSLFFLTPQRMSGAVRDKTVINQLFIGRNQFSRAWQVRAGW